MGNVAGGIPYAEKDVPTETAMLPKPHRHMRGLYYTGHLVNACYYERATWSPESTEKMRSSLERWLVARDTGYVSPAFPRKDRAISTVQRKDRIGMSSGTRLHAHITTKVSLERQLAFLRRKTFSVQKSP